MAVGPMDDLIQDFIAETREMLEALGGEVVAWEAAPHDRERLDAIFRFVHTVKGNCGFFDLPRLEMLSHAAEDVLADVRSGNRTADNGLVSAVLAVIDRIGERVLGGVTQLLKARQIEEAAIAFDGVDEAENLVEPGAIARRSLPRHDLAPEGLEHLARFGDEFRKKIVHGAPSASGDGALMATGW